MKAKEKELYKADILERGYKNINISVMIFLISATILYIALYDNVNNEVLLLWYIVILVALLVRFMSYKLYTNYKKILLLKKQESIFYTGLFFSTILLALLPVLFFTPEKSSSQNLIIVTTIVGLSAIEVYNLLSVKKAAQLFLATMLIPLIIKFFLFNTMLYFLMALLATLYMIALLYIVAKLNKKYTEILLSNCLHKIEKERLKASQERFEAVFKQAPIGILIYDTNLAIQEVNHELTKIIGAGKDLLIGLNMNTLPDNRILPSLKAPLDNNEGCYIGEYITKFRKKKIWASMNSSPLRDTNNKITGGIAIVSDITEQVSIKLKLEHRAKHDFLTNIPNRLTLFERVEQEIERFKRHGILFGLMFLDLDCFKEINDSLGHDIGDKILIETAKRLKETTRSGDMVARLGGDEFIVLFSDLLMNQEEAIAHLKSKAKQILNKLRQTYEIGKNKLNISTSIGISLMQNNKKTPEDLIREADVAMYNVKNSGRNDVMFYKPTC